MKWISAEREEKKGRRPMEATPRQVIIRLNPNKSSFGMRAVYKEA